MSEFRVCAVIPTYDNPLTIELTVQRVRAHVSDIIVVDDGSGPEAKQSIARLASSSPVVVITRKANGGKGSAVKDGLREAYARGYTHALQIDADGQHDTNDIPRLIAEAQAHPLALVLAAPVFSSDAPKGRLLARKLTVFWTNIETGGAKIVDPMCGFRVYPLQATQALTVRGNRMDFDPEIAVRLVWNGVEVRSVPSKVRYVQASEGGISHFRMVKDNALISLMHSRLCIEAMGRAMVRPWKK